MLSKILKDVELVVMVHHGLLKLVVCHSHIFMKSSKLFLTLLEPPQ
jgi:hypothetical protein